MAKAEVQGAQQLSMIFADYRYYPNQMVYHKVYDALERYGIENNVIRESGE